MTDISRKISAGEREILKNQRLIMMALINVLNPNTPGAEAMMRRLVEMDRDWEFIATAKERFIPYEPKRS